MDHSFVRFNFGRIQTVSTCPKYRNDSVFVCPVLMVSHYTSMSLCQSARPGLNARSLLVPSTLRLTSQTGDARRGGAHAKVGSLKSGITTQTQLGAAKTPSVRSFISTSCLAVLPADTLSTWPRSPSPQCSSARALTLAAGPSWRRTASGSRRSRT